MAIPAYSVEAIRNIALVGNTGSGKTSLVESLLLAAGVIGAAGTVERGTTVCDYDPQEKAQQHSLNVACASLEHQGTHINLLDTPGFPDFIGRVLSVLPAVETVAVVIDAATGVDNQAERFMSWARDRGLDRMIIVNKIDTAPEKLETLLAEIQEAFGAECLPLNLPAGGAAKILDCFFQPSGEATDFSSVKDAHTALVDQVVEVDEKLMELYLEQGQELSPEQLHEPFEEALRDDHLVPVCFVSGRSGAGVDELLRVFAQLMPNPAEGHVPPFLLGEGKDAKPVSVTPDPDKHALAHVFKVAVDPFVGKLAVFRIHQGTITKDSQLFIGDGRKPFKIAHLFRLQGKEHVEIECGLPGDICAVGKAEDIYFDAVLHDSHEEDHIHLKPISLPEPMYGLAIEPKRRGDEQKISDGLHKLSAEDPSIKVEHNAVLNETVMRGMGEMHLRVLLEGLAERFHVEVDTRPPKIAYRETITSNAEGHHRHKKQTGGAGQFGEVFLRVEPLERGAGFEFVDAVVGGAIPRQFIPAVEKGIRQVLQDGAIAGYALHDVRVTVYDGKYHSVDSKEVAFSTAGRKAFLDAVKKAHPVVLEPIVNVDIKVPNENVGDITSDLAGKRGRIQNTNGMAGGMSAITGQVPLSELASYTSQLKSITAGKGWFSMELSHYEAVPARVQQELISQFKPGVQED
jgi:elongation factor G